MGDDNERFREDVKRLWDTLCSARSEAWDCRDTAKRLGDKTENGYAQLAQIIDGYAQEVKDHAKFLGVEFEE